jgi:very-short-patch-repair endonuclease
MKPPYWNESAMKPHELMEPCWDEVPISRSAIEWPDMRPPEEHVTANNFTQIASFAPVDVWAAAVKIAPDCDDSPIEIEFGARLINAIRLINDPDFLKLKPQHVLGPYRYDFAIFREDKLVALVECDGREFHSTEEQLANDRAKNELAAKEGGHIFRFSGSDIYRDGNSCVRDVLHKILARNHLSPAEWGALNTLLAPRPFCQFAGGLTSNC